MRGSQTLQWLSASHIKVVQEETLAITRPDRPVIASVIERRRASPEPGLSTEMVASRGLMVPVAPVQSPYPLICEAAPAFIAAVEKSMCSGTW